MSEIDIEPEKSVMVGNKPFTDIRGAKNVGIKTILIERRDWNDETNPNLEI